MIAVTISSKPVRGLYDTGADVSCISEAVFLQLPSKDREKLVECKSGGPVPQQEANK